MKNNLHKKVIEDFGNEWETYNQSELDQQEHNRLFKKLF